MSFTTTSLFSPVASRVMNLLENHLSENIIRGSFRSGSTPNASSTSAETTTPKKRKTDQEDAPAAIRRCKRARPAVSYAEIDSDDELINDSDDEYSAPSKKPRAAKPLPKKKIFPFLSLPRELRDMIYQECLIDSIGGVYIEQRILQYRRTAVRVPEGPTSYTANYGYIDVTGESMPCWPHAHYPPRNDDSDELPHQPHQQSMAPALLSLCKQTHAEAAALLYGQPLYFEDTCALHGFLGALTSATRGLLRDVTVLEVHRWRSIRKNFDVAAMTLLAEGGTNLRRLRHADGGSYNDTPKRAARRFYRNAFRWLDVVRRKMGVHEAAGLVEMFSAEYAISMQDDPLLDRKFRDELVRLMAKDMEF